MAVYITLPELAERPGAEELSQAATPQSTVGQSELLDALLRWLAGGPVDAGGDRGRQRRCRGHRQCGERCGPSSTDSCSNGLPALQAFWHRGGWHRAITRYLLHRDRLGEGAEKDPIVRDYRDALKFLQLTAEGKFSLGQDDRWPTPPAGSPGGDSGPNFQPRSVEGLLTCPALHSITT